MKASYTLFLLALYVSKVSATLSNAGSTFLIRERFERFKKEHSKLYETLEEEEKRFAIFEEQIEKIAKKNAALRDLGHDEIHGITRFADATPDEFSFFLGLDASGEIPEMEVLETVEKVNHTKGVFNWNDEGMLTKVKNQAQCGSCWAFSASETIESAWARAGNSLVELAPQQLVSCDKVDAGCNGGLPSNAFEYVEKAGGMALASDYPYTSKFGTNGQCMDPLPSLKQGSVSEWGYAAKPCSGFRACKEDTAEFASALKEYGPASIAIDASEWSSYVGGVMTSASCSNSPRRMDHAVQVVGWNFDAPTPYWIVRNSWSASWGEEGFIYLAVGENTCGITNLAAQVKSV